MRSQWKWSAMAALKRHDNCVVCYKHIRWLHYFIFSFKWNVQIFLHINLVSLSSFFHGGKVIFKNKNAFICLRNSMMKMDDAAILNELSVYRSVQKRFKKRHSLTQTQPPWNKTRTQSTRPNTWLMFFTKMSTTLRFIHFERYFKVVLFVFHFVFIALTVCHIYSFSISSLSLFWISPQITIFDTNTT